MALTAHIRPYATAQLYAAAAWYQEQEPEQDLWLELIAEFDEVVNLVSENPEIFIEWEAPVRRAVLKRFPYALYYLVEPERIVVLRFLAMAQEQISLP